MADEENNEPKKKGFILRILIFVVAGLVLIGAGLGGGYILFGGSQPDPSEEIESIIEKNSRFNLRQECLAFQLHEISQLPSDSIDLLADPNIISSRIFPSPGAVAAN